VGLYIKRSRARFIRLPSCPYLLSILLTWPGELDYNLAADVQAAN
jgi:hypothetical protein